tara:strand:- start:183 stop:635 length:453 start_codon:yes stop_codon:yes gene_type:complete
MLPKWHILFGFIFAYIIYWATPITFFQASLIFLAGIVIDLDHYFRYVLLKKDINPNNFWNWSMKRKKRWNNLQKKERKKYKLAIFAFHGIEFFILLILIYFIFPIFFYIILGISFHLLLDFIELVYLKIPLYSKISPILVYIKNKNKKEF